MMTVILITKYWEQEDEHDHGEQKHSSREKKKKTQKVTGSNIPGRSNYTGEAARDLMKESEEKNMGRAVPSAPLHKKKEREESGEKIKSQFSGLKSAHIPSFYISFFYSCIFSMSDRPSYEKKRRGKES